VTEKNVDFKVKMWRFRVRLGLCDRPFWVSGDVFLILYFARKI
jgi:hypothetical protein